MTVDLASYAKEKGIKYFMISFTDLFGGQRAKLVPAQSNDFDCVNAFVMAFPNIV